MSLRLRLFLGLASLVAVLVAAQWWWVRGLTRDLSDEVGNVALEVGNSLASIFVHRVPDCAEESCGEESEDEAVVVHRVGGQGAVASKPDLVLPLPPKKHEVHWVGFKEEDDDPSADPGGEPRTRKVKVSRRVHDGEATQEIVLRLDVVDDHHEEEHHVEISAGEVSGGAASGGETSPEDKSRWFGVLAGEAPVRAGFLTVIDAGENDARRIPIPSEGLNEKLERFRRRMLWGSLGIFAFGLLLSAVVAHRVTAPLRHLARAAREVGEGAFGTQVPVTSSGEVGQAIHAFNRMSNELDSLDRKTRELRARQHLGEIGEIARGLAHTLRNPLNALGLSVEELSGLACPPSIPPGGRAPGEAAELAGAARRQIRRIDHSIRSFLALASQNGGGVAEVDPAELVRDVALEALQDCRGSRPLGGIEGGEYIRLDVDANDEVPAVRAVEPELRAVLQALLVNAVEASPEGGTVSIRVLSEDSDRVRVEIEDEGPGLPEEVRGRLFTPHLTTKATGSGMGLFLAHRIATTRYGGRLALEDRAQGGTRAVLILGPRNQELDHG